ncbi:uncharacterized protein LOC142976613 [Anticarsia gemmatalis]|uniref:uncharacterized protein LOC142976613 n=1 Tax=Anticarsia gemmatalis TaxID=129554 RepID=UPI003F7721E4
MGFNKTAQARHDARNMWEEIALSLNSHDDGAVKDWKGWCKYWNDYKCKLKKAASHFKSSEQSGEEPSSVRTFSDIELKFLSIFDDYKAGVPSLRDEPFEQETQRQNEEVRMPSISSSNLVLTILP